MFPSFGGNLVRRQKCSKYHDLYYCLIAKILVTSPIVTDMLTRELLAGETKSSFV